MSTSDVIKTHVPQPRPKNIKFQGLDTKNDIETVSRPSQTKTCIKT